MGLPPPLASLGEKGGSWAFQEILLCFGAEPVSGKSSALFTLVSNAVELIAGITYVHQKEKICLGICSSPQLLWPIARVGAQINEKKTLLRCWLLQGAIDKADKAASETGPNLLVQAMYCRCWGCRGRLGRTAVPQTFMVVTAYFEL